MGLFSRNNNTNKPLIFIIIDLATIWIIVSCNYKFKFDKVCSTYKIYDQFVALTLGQLKAD